MDDTIDVFLVKRSKGNRKRNVRMRYRCPLSLKWVYRSTGTIDAKAAEEARVVWEHELRTGRYAKAGRLAWEEFRERYLDSVAADDDKSPRTLEKATGTFNAVGRILSPRTVADVTAERLAYLKTELLADGRKPTTVKTHLAYLRSALNNAVEWGVLSELPTFPKFKRQKGGAGKMKGRPITGEEFERMLTVVPKVVPEHAVASWRLLLRGLWTSGLRLGEACELYWTGHRGHLIDLDGRRPRIRVSGGLEKGKRDRLLPLAPEFVELLETFRPEARTGRVFRPASKVEGGDTPQPHRVGEIIGAIGREAGVVVASDPRSGKPTKFATAHDLRRTFGRRWAPRVMPAVLKELMRHASIETTMAFYVGENADATAEVVWEAFEKATCATKCATGEPEESEALVF